MQPIKYNIKYQINIAPKRLYNKFGRLCKRKKEVVETDPTRIWRKVYGVLGWKSGYCNFLNYKQGLSVK